MAQTVRRVWCGVLVFLAAAMLFLGWRFWPRELEPEFTLPEGTQLLTYPLENGLITAGYRNVRYREKNLFEHYGIDFTPYDGKEATVYASGVGTVLETETCDNNLGNIVVIQYDNVYDPTFGITHSVVARYYHLLSIAVKRGDVLSPNQPLGRIDGRHQWYNHVHLEFDTDLAHPFHTPQVAERSSELLIRYPATGESLLDPVTLLVVDKGQKTDVHPNSDCCDPKDRPAYRRAQFAPL